MWPKLTFKNNQHVCINDILLFMQKEYPKKWEKNKVHCLIHQAHAFSMHFFFFLM